jgi:hypothetical protein
MAFNRVDSYTRIWKPAQAKRYDFFNSHSGWSGQSDRGKVIRPRALP